MIKTKNIILGIILILIFAIVLVSFKIFFKLANTNGKEVKNIIIDEEGDTEIRDFIETTDIDSISRLYTIEKIIQNYFDILNTNSDVYYNRNRERIVTDEEINKNILNILSEKYMSRENINLDSIDQKIKKIENKVRATTIDIKMKRKDNMEKYAVYGELVDLNNKIYGDFKIYVNLDTANKTYSIEPIYEKKTDINDFEIEDISIKSNDSNKYKYEVLSSEGAIQYYINKFKTLTLADTQLSYNLIDDEYKEKKFKTIDEYRKYIDLNTNRIKNTVIEKYMVKYNNKYTEFICVDQNGFYYIFRQYTPLNCKVLLDNYTIDSEEFIKKYDEGNSQTKVGMNIEKFISALNCKDYEYIYSKLDEAFKNNNFKTIDDLKKYLDNNSYSTNKITYNTFEEKGNGIYTYQTEISDASNDNSPIKELTIIMKLNANREYVMSFSIN